MGALPQWRWIRAIPTESIGLDKPAGTAFCYRAQACYNEVCGDWSASLLVKIPALAGPPDNFRKQSTMEITKQAIP